MEEVDRGSGRQFAPGPAGAFLTLPYELFRDVKKVEPTREDGPILPFTERFYRHQRALSAAG
jgi:hypothetical protein